MSIEFLQYDPKPINLHAPPGGIERYHEFDKRSVAAINAALASGRPLLVRGEPGVGKTQLAEAAAEKLERAFLRFVVDARTESRELLYQFDAVMRLAEAQLCGAERAQPVEARARLSLPKFVRPGPLWWAFNWTDAQEHCQLGCGENIETPLEVQENTARAPKGWVILIDEIDKGESDVPNGLLEALGSGGFKPLGRAARVEMSEPAPLVVITTNEERILPDAFVRRCLVLNLKLPELPHQRQQLIGLLKHRGAAHFPLPSQNGDDQQKHDQLLERAAELTVIDRQTAMENQFKPLPGQAEYLDLLRGVIRRADDPDKRIKLLESVANYALKKHPDMQVVDVEE